MQFAQFRTTPNSEGGHVHIACGEAHTGPVCNNGKVMCQLCFDMFTIDQLNTVNGTPEDVCKDCANS